MTDRGLPARHALLGRYYEPIRVIGRGAFGEAVLSRCTVSGAMVVLKCMTRLALPVSPAPGDEGPRRAIATPDEEQRRLLRNALREVRSHATLPRHHFVVGFLGSWVERSRGQLILATEYCAGGDLERAARRAAPSGGMPEAAVRVWAVQLLLALRHIHRHKFVHRDVKLPNVFLFEDPTHGVEMARGVVDAEGPARAWSVRLGDFGLSRALPGSGCAETQAGTPYYFSPEVALQQPHDGRTDVWGLGVALYVLLFGCFPFMGRGIMGVIAAIRTAEPARLTAGDAPGSRELRELIGRMLVKDPRARPTAADLLQIPWVRKIAASLAAAESEPEGIEPASPSGTCGPQGPGHEDTRARPAPQMVLRAVAINGDGAIVSSTSATHATSDTGDDDTTTFLAEVNVRAAPDTGAPVVGVLTAGDVIEVAATVEVTALEGGKRSRWLLLRAPCPNGYCVFDLAGTPLFDATP